MDAFFSLAPQHGWDPRQLRVACETMATTNRVVIAGETRGPSAITRDYIAHVARLAVKEIGYEQAGFHWEKASIEVSRSWPWRAPRRHDTRRRDA